MENDSVLVPLSTLDYGAGLDGILSIFSYIVEGPIDVDALRAASFRLVDKWRLLAGYLESGSGGVYFVRVPLRPLSASEPRIHFTVTTSTGKLPTPPLEPLNDDTACTYEEPSTDLFVHKSTTGSLSAIVKNKAPLLSIHVNSFADYTCIGIAASHAFFDGVGQGYVTQCLDAELNGRAWTPPPFGPTNIVQELLDKFNAETKTSSTPPMLENVKRELVPRGFTTMAALGASIAYEHFWNKVECREVFLGKNVTQRLVSKTKADVKKIDPNAWVSTGDILVMWFLQSAYSEEPEDENQTFSMFSSFSIRNLLADKYGEDFRTYPHNCIAPCILTPITKASVQRASLAELALIHRRAIEEVRNLEYVQAWTRHVKALGRPSLFSRRRGHEGWTVTNQVMGKPTEIFFGAPTVRFFYTAKPLMPDHIMLMNELNGGFILQLKLTRSRWEAVERAMKKI